MRMMFKAGQTVRFIKPPKEEFREVLATVVEVRYGDEELRVQINNEFLEKDPRIKNQIYRYPMNRFEIVKKELSEEKRAYMNALKAKPKLSPTEVFILDELENLD